MEPHTKETRKQLSPMIWISIIAGILLVSVFAGMQYLKNSSNKTDTANTGQLSMGSGSAGGGGMVINGSGGQHDPGGEPCANGQRRAVMNIGGAQIMTCGTPSSGKVTAVTSDAITITDNSDGSSKTFAITGDTAIVKKGGVNINLSEISVGENVGIIPADDNSTAKRILADLPS